MEIFCLLSAVRPAARRESIGPELEQVGDGADAGVDGGGGDAAVAQREGEIVVDGHGVVDDRELEDLGDVALGRGEAGDVAVVEEDLAFAGDDEAGDDVEERGLAAAGGAEERVGAAVLPFEVDRLQRVVVGAARVRGCRRGGGRFSVMRAIRRPSGRRRRSRGRGSTSR